MSLCVCLCVCLSVCLSACLSLFFSLFFVCLVFVLRGCAEGWGVVFVFVLGGCFGLVWFVVVVVVCLFLVVLLCLVVVLFLHNSIQVYSLNTVLFLHVKDIKFLCKDDMFADDIRIPESETDMEHFREWWRQLLLQRRPMSLDRMKEIVGRSGANSKHWYTTSFLQPLFGERCRKAMLGV